MYTKGDCPGGCDKLQSLFKSIKVRQFLEVHHMFIALWELEEDYSGGQNCFNVYYFGTEGLIQNRIKYKTS